MSNKLCGFTRSSRCLVSVNRRGFAATFLTVGGFGLTKSVSLFKLRCCRIITPGTETLRFMLRIKEVIVEEAKCVTIILLGTSDVGLWWAHACVRCMF